jgi:hypothetical protein
MVHEVADRHLLGQLPDPAHVIGMIMRDHQVVDLLHSCRLGRGGDALGIALVVSAPPRVHQHRFARRGYDQRGLPSFHVDRVDFQIPGRRQHCRRRHQENSRT